MYLQENFINDVSVLLRKTLESDLCQFKLEECMKILIEME